MLTVYTVEQSKQWDAVVRSFQEYDVYYLNGYVRAFQLHGDGDPLLFYYEGNNTRGINVVMKRDVADDPHFAARLEQNTYFDLVTPYGYGGWIIEGRESKALFTEYEDWCRQHSVVSEFVRYHPLLKTQDNGTGFYEVVPLGETIAMELSSQEDIWLNLSSKNRNVIRKAQKNGVKIYNGRYPEIYGEFHKIYDETMNKDKAEQYYYFEDEFYDSILNDLPQNAQVFYAQIPNGTIIAASIMIWANGRMNYHLSGSVREYAHLAPTNLLLYQAALWGYENGLKTLHLGGGVGSDEDGLFKFKRSFYKGKLNRFYIGKKIYDAKNYDKLVSMRENTERSSFFPTYRAK